MKRLAILGATGSIGRQTLAVAERERARVAVAALAAGSDLDGLLAAARATGARLLALERASDPASARESLREAVPGAAVHVGPGSAVRLVREAPVDVVVNGIVGAAGLAPSLAALERGLVLALANKETLVVGGDLALAALERGGGTIVPVDSEHSAAFQCLGGRAAETVERLTLTASGGPLLRHPDWRNATPAEVLRHPVWDMGARITVDSALLVNKALELIEARWLFALGWDRLEAVIHPQALVHAIVRFADGSTVLQAARPDMALPIQVALAWPGRWGRAVPPLEAADLARLEFHPIRPGAFPAFERVLAAGRAGGTAPCAANAADEVAVEAFLDGAIALGQVPELLTRVLDAHDPRPVESLEQLEEVDRWARAEARKQAVRA